jgi:hypothetical protein
MSVAAVHFSFVGGFQDRGVISPVRQFVGQIVQAFGSEAEVATRRDKGVSEVHAEFAVGDLAKESLLRTKGYYVGSRTIGELVEDDIDALLLDSSNDAVVTISGDSPLCLIESLGYISLDNNSRMTLYSYNTGVIGSVHYPIDTKPPNLVQDSEINFTHAT